jgi:hypothetical protein
VSISTEVGATWPVACSVDTGTGCGVLACRRSQEAAISTNATPIRMANVANTGRIQ